MSVYVQDYTESAILTGIALAATTLLTTVFTSRLFIKTNDARRTRLPSVFEWLGVIAILGTS